MTPIWPSAYLEQRDFVATFEDLLREVEGKIRVPTLVQNIEPTESELNAAWSELIGYTGQVPEGGRVQWFRPDRGQLMSLYTRVGDAGLPIDGQLLEAVARPGDPSTEVLHYNFLEAAAASINTGTLSQGYLDLMVIVRLRTTQAVAEANVGLQFNSVVAANYSSETLRAVNTGLVASESIGATSIPFTVPAATSGRTQYSTLTLLIPNYANTTRKKSVWGIWGTFRDPTIAADDMFHRVLAGTFNIVGAISSIQLIPAAGNIEKGSSITVIGIK